MHVKFGCTGITAQVLMDTADQFVKLGLDKVGFEYVNSDDCWMLDTRPDGGQGAQIPNPEKFPNGMRPVADYIHSKGLKLGLCVKTSNLLRYLAFCTTSANAVLQSIFAFILLRRRPVRESLLGAKVHGRAYGQQHMR
jgi:hypothetical protein